MGSLDKPDLFKSRALLDGLIKDGYRVVSRRHRHVSRIDRADWFESLNKKRFFGNLKEEERDSMEDHYRRGYSHDRLILPEKLDIRAVPNSGRAVTGYTGEKLSDKKHLGLKSYRAAAPLDIIDVEES